MRDTFTGALNRSISRSSARVECSVRLGQACLHAVPPPTSDLVHRLTPAVVRPLETGFRGGSAEPLILVGPRSSLRLLARSPLADC